MVVYSSAVKPGNLAYDAAVAAGIVLLRRAEALAAIMRTKSGIIVAGTHGKTTTSALLAHVMRVGQLKPSHYVGAEIPLLGTNAFYDRSTKWITVTVMSRSVWNPLTRKLPISTDYTIDLLAQEAASSPLAPQAPQLPTKAKRCIMLFMEGGPSQVDTFDPKPELNKRHLKHSSLTQAIESGDRFFVGSPFGSRKVGQAGIDMCDLITSRTRSV